MRSRMEFCRTSTDDPLQGGQGRRGGRDRFASVYVSDLFEMFASGCPSESIEIRMPRLRLSDQRRSEWSEISRREAWPCGEGPLLLRISAEGSQGGLERFVLLRRRVKYEEGVRKFVYTKILTRSTRS